LQESAVKQNHDYCNAAERMAKVESRASMSIYLQATGGQNMGAKILGDVMKVEEMTERFILNNGDMMVGGFVKDITTKLSQLKIDQKGISYDGEESLKKWKSIDKSSLALNDANELGHTAAKMTQSNMQFKKNVQSLESEVDSLSLARKLVHEHPDYGHLWLQFAKELAKEVTDEDCSTDESQKVFDSALDSAISAANKAYFLMHEEVANVRLLVPRRKAERVDLGLIHQQHERHHHFSHKPVVPEAVDAALVSECLALISWLNEMQNDDNTEEDCNTIATSIELQRSLLLDPENTLARAGLDM